jgi:hypothetical protein
MPPEYYIGIGIAVILLALLFSLIKPGRGRRQTAQRKNGGTAELSAQLKRIADSLEILVAHMGASQAIQTPVTERPVIEKPAPVTPPVEVAATEKQAIEKAPVPAQEAPVQPADADQLQIAERAETEGKKVDQPVERHVKLSMFGR